MSMAHSESPSVALRGCLEACDRCLAVIDHVSPDLFRGEVGGVSGVGTHLRHCIDHIACLLQGQETGEIDYDARERQPEIERDPETCRTALLDAREGLAGLANIDEEQPIHVVQSCSLSTPPQRLLSSLGRELAFLSSHTIHHLSVIEVVCKDAGNPLPEGFALAFSTAAYRARQAS